MLKGPTPVYLSLTQDQPIFPRPIQPVLVDPPDPNRHHPDLWLGELTSVGYEVA